MLYKHKDNKKYDQAFYNKPILSHCLDGIIWKRVPKQCSIKLKIFKIGVYDSVAHFNVGNLVTLFIYGAVWYRQELNELWMGVSTRRMLRGLRKSKNCGTKNKEGNVYGARMASWKM